MRLVEILGKELNEWPQGVRAMTQNINTSVCGFSGDKALPICYGRWFWYSPEGIDLGMSEIGIGDVALATDHATAIVTRADWKAEREKLKEILANVDGWVPHHGVDCPVPPDALVDLRCRNGRVYEGGMASCFIWKHTDNTGDVMAYRIHKPAEQPAPVSEEAIQVGIDAADAGRLTPISEVKARILSRPLEWRNRIYELDTQHAEVESDYQRQISEITQERESLVQKLAGEGLALVEVAGQSVEGMSDWRNWKAGDLIECVGGMSHYYTIGKRYEVEKVLDTGLVMDDDNNGGCHNWSGDQVIAGVFKWHSRPAS